MKQYSNILIDGNNLACKCYYTHKDLSTVVHGTKVYTGVAYGCLVSLASLNGRWLKDGGTIIIVWDRGYTRKAQIYPGYKKERREKRDVADYQEFVEQRDLLEKFLKYTKFPVAFAKGEEADDVIATLTKNILLNNEKSRILIVSSDRDFHQLVSSRVTQMVDSAKGREKIFTPKEIKAKHGVSPINYLVIQLLTGCKGDGVPGLRLVGPKTALKIIEASTNAELVNFRNPYKVKVPKAVIDCVMKKWKLKEVTREETEQGLLEHFNMTLKLLRLERELKHIKFRRGKANENRLTDLCVEYEFMSLLKGGRIKEIVS